MTEPQSCSVGPPYERLGRPLQICILLTLLAVTRWPLSTRWLFYFDNINFALALTHFNPALHQPQPPGNPLFVGLMRVIYVFVREPNKVELISGLVGSGAALVLLYTLAAELWGSTEALAAALLLLFHPTFWSAGLMNPCRTFLAAGSCAVGLVVWKAWNRPAVRWLYLTAAALGIASGFRPELLVLLLPLSASTLIVTRRISEVVFAISILVISTGTWVGVLSLSVGGLVPLAGLMLEYLALRSQYSLLFGGTGHAAVRHLSLTAEWVLVPALAWIWSIPVTWPHRTILFCRNHLRFLSAWVLPPAVFYALIHINDADQALTIAPVVCLLGARFLRIFTDRFYMSFSHRDALAAIIIGLAVSLTIPQFFYKFSRFPKATGYYQVLRQVDKETTELFALIDDLKKRGPVYLVSGDSFITWRQVSYYFPNERLLVLNGRSLMNPDKHSGAAWLIQHRHRLVLDPLDNNVPLPPNGPILWLLPWDASLRSMIMKSLPGRVEQKGFTAVFQLKPGIDFSIGAYHFVARN